MQTASTAHKYARTFLTHFFGRGLDDDRYVVQRFQSTLDGEIKPFSGTARSGGTRKQARKVMSLRAVQRLRPERNEIIIATGVALAGGVQLYGDLASGLFVSGRHR